MFEGREICEGAVTKELSTVVKICEGGKLKIKRKSDIAPGWPKAGGGEGSRSFGELRMMSTFRMCLVRRGPVRRCSDSGTVHPLIIIVL